MKSRVVIDIRVSVVSELDKVFRFLFVVHFNMKVKSLELLTLQIDCF